MPRTKIDHSPGGAGRASGSLALSRAAAREDGARGRVPVPGKVTGGRTFWLLSIFSVRCVLCFCVCLFVCVVFMFVCVVCLCVLCLCECVICLCVCACLRPCLCTYVFAYLHITA